jgi:hypothetical protein
MAASSSTMTIIALMPVSEKLVCSNHMVWKEQVLTILRGAQLTGFLDGTNPALTSKIKIKIPKEATKEIEEVPNPSFIAWKAHEQLVLSYLLTSISHPCTSCCPAICS